MNPEKHLLKNEMLESTGYIGATLIVTAYFLVSFNIIQANSLTFQFLNLIGAGGNIIYYLRKKAYSGAILDAFWGIIAIIALIRLFFI